jgi:hypothetical protein
MRSIPTRNRSAVARRIAAGLPLWAACRGSAIAAEDVSTLMGEPDFRELISAWTDIFELDDEARKRRLLTLASMILEDRLERGCNRTAWFVSRQYNRKHGPREALAKGFAQLIDMEKARAERFGRSDQIRPAPPPPTPVHAAMAEAEAARKLRAKPDPVDAAAWRQAGTLRRQMLGEQVLFAAAAPKPVEEILAAQPAPAAAAPAAQPQAQPKLNRAQRRRQEKLRKAKPAKPAPPPAPPATAETAADGSDAAFRERAIKTFAATFAAAPPHLRDALDRLTPQQRLALIEQCWPEDEAFDESPQGP